MSFEEIQLELGIATQCGQCEDCARELVAQCAGRQRTIPRLDSPYDVRFTTSQERGA